MRHAKSKSRLRRSVALHKNAELLWRASVLASLLFHGYK